MKRILHVSVAVLLLLMAVLTFAACGSDPDYDIFNVEYDPVNKLLTWNDNSPAESWLVSINGEDNEKVKTNEYEYDANDQTFDVRIEGLYKDKGHELNPVARVTVTYLPPVQNLRVENGYLVWDHVPGATGYTVNNNGYTSYAGECSYQIPAGAFNITVYPETNGCFYTYPSETVSGVIMAAPQNLRYENGAFVWDAVANAEYYEVVINGTTYETTQPSYAYERNKTDIHIAVSAGSRQEGAYKSSPLERTCYYLKPIAAANYSFNAEGALTWPAVENATHYVVTINGQNTETVSEPKYSNIAIDTRYTVKVVPMADFSYTDEAVEYTFEKLSPVTGVKFAEGKITWDAHPRAVSYEVKVNGQSYNATGTSYDMSGVKETLNIEVYAKGDIENARSYTAAKEVYTYLPVVTNITVKDGVLVWSASEGAVRYDLQFADGTVSSEVAAYDNFQAGPQYIVKIIPRGADKSYSYWSAEFSFKILPAPEINYDMGVFYWQGSNDANGYTVNIEMSNGETRTETLSQTTTRYKYDFTTPGQYKLSVKTNAKPGENVYDSKYSAVKNVTKLAAVTSHELLNSTISSDNVQISVGAVEGASYTVFVNGTQQTVSTSNTFSLDLLSQVVADRETNFTIGVLATGSVTADRIVLDASTKYEFNLKRLATPQNVKVESNKIKWNDVSNATKYIVSIDGSTVECGTSTHTLTNLSEGAHVIRVWAINRDSQQYIPSGQSAPLNVTKLSTPANVTVYEDKGAVYVRWTQVNGATGYQLQVGSEMKPVNTTFFPISDYTSGLAEGEGLQISVYASGDGNTIIDSEPSAVKTIAKLSAPTGLGVSGDNITWNPSAVDGVAAIEYELTIRCNGETQTFTEKATQYSVSNLAAGTYTISVKAIGNNTETLSSKDSGTITVTKLAQVQNVKREAGSSTITWDAMSDISGYIVGIHGQEYQEYTVTTPSFNVADKFTENRTYTVTIRPFSGDPNVIDGDAVKIEQDVRAILPPEYTVEVQGNRIVFTATPVEGLPVKYHFNVEGVDYGKNESNVNSEYALQYAGTYTVKVKCVVSCFGQDGIYYIDSMYSADRVVEYDPNAQ